MRFGTSNRLFVNVRRFHDAKNEKEEQAYKSNTYGQHAEAANGNEPLPIATPPVLIALLIHLSSSPIHFHPSSNPDI